MLAIAFLATLLVTIALLIVHITGIYQKGISIRAVNTVGRELIDEFSRVIGGSPIVDIDRDKNGYIDDDEYLRYYSQVSISGATIGGGSADQPVNGAFCTGKFSYIWNTGFALNEFKDSGGATDHRLGYRSEGGADNYDFRLMRIPDDKRSICAVYNSLTASGASHVLIQSSSSVDIDGELTDVTLDKEGVELLDSNESRLALYDFRVYPVSVNELTGHAFYSATFVLATLAGGVDIYSNGDFCTDPRDSNDEVVRSSSTNLTTDFSYCAVNKFNFAMRATGQTIDNGQGQYGER